MKIIEKFNDKIKGVLSGFDKTGKLNKIILIQI